MTSSANIAIQIKKSGETGNTPVGLQHGEIAINYADGKLYYKDDLDVIRYITNQDTFSTINSNGTLVLASNFSDILNIVAGNNISISTDAGTKTITINSSSQGGDSTAAFNQANAAFQEANSAYILAQGAFDKANAVSGGTSSSDYFPIGDYGYYDAVPTDPYFADEPQLVEYDMKTDPIFPRNYYLKKDLGYV